MTPETEFYKLLKPYFKSALVLWGKIVKKDFMFAELGLPNLEGAYVIEILSDETYNLYETNYKKYSAIYHTTAQLLAEEFSVKYDKDRNVIYFVA